MELPSCCEISDDNTPIEADSYIRLRLRRAARGCVPELARRLRPCRGNGVAALLPTAARQMVSDAFYRCSILLDEPLRRNVLLPRTISLRDNLDHVRLPSSPASAVGCGLLRRLLSANTIG